MRAALISAVFAGASIVYSMPSLVSARNATVGSAAMEDSNLQPGCGADNCNEVPPGLHLPCVGQGVGYCQAVMKCNSHDPKAWNVNTTCHVTLYDHTCRAIGHVDGDTILEAWGLTAGDWKRHERRDWQTYNMYSELPDVVVIFSYKQGGRFVGAHVMNLAFFYAGKTYGQDGDPGGEGLGWPWHATRVYKGPCIPEPGYEGGSCFFERVSFECFAKDGGWKA